MPTTEIISVGAPVGPHTPRLRIFAQRCDSRLISDRDLFQPILATLEGTMIHLGDYADTPDDPCWFCSHVIEYPAGDDEDDHFRYESAAFEELKQLLHLMQEQSPARHVIFLTDYQFGPDQSRVVEVATIDEFSRLNRQGKIRFNTLYHIGRNRSE